MKRTNYKTGKTIYYLLYKGRPTLLSTTDASVDIKFSLLYPIVKGRNSICETHRLSPYHAKHGFILF